MRAEQSAGANCGIDDLDYVARMTWECNDVGVDTIELGSTIAMEGELQAFHAREIPRYGWTIETFQPYPGQHDPSDPELLGRIAFKTA